MRRVALTLTIIVSLSAGVLLRADDLVLGRFGDYLESLRAQAGIPGLAAVIVGPTDIMWDRGFGQQNVERSVQTLAITPFHADGLTQLLTASVVLRCVEEGRVSLDARIGDLVPGAPEPGATIRQLLSHTSGPSDGLTFSYRPERLAPLASVISSCAGGAAGSFRSAIVSKLDSLAMTDSVPGPDAVNLGPSDPGMSLASLERYRGILNRLATPYAVDAQGRASVSRYNVSTLTPGSGLVSTVRNLAQFELALKRGVLLRPETVTMAWTAPVGRNGQQLPHGLGWFVQSYAGEPIIWQFGVGDGASSGMVLIAPRRGLTLILLANSDGLARPFSLAAGDVTVSPFARAFLGIFVR
jgi:CubicO group peptidase (beta-lactamase class C family)